MRGRDEEKRRRKRGGWRRKRERRQPCIAGSTKGKSRDGHAGRTTVIFRCDEYP